MPTDVTIDTPSGPVVGVREPGGLRFGGVPYARADRWGLPEPCSWREPFDATTPGAGPPQTVGGLDLVPGMIPASQSEACLTAEIFTTALDGSRPVLVWVPGGSYRIGAASLPTYDGAHLAAHGVVVVGLNYRLGALGWLAADGVPSNLGLRDLRAAVAWLRANVPAFGGDPDRIVLMGESAGSGCLAHLLAAPSPFGHGAGGTPVAGAILQSGAPAGTLDAEAATWVGEQFLDAAGASSVDALATTPIDVLLAAQEQTVEGALAKVGMMPFHPWVDGDLLTGPAYRAEFPAIPLVVGTTAQEMELFRDQVPALPDDIAVMFLAGKAAGLGITDEARVRAALEACGGDLVEAVADLELHLPNELLARAHRARGNPVYRYRFNWEAPVRRACHALDLPFTFGTLDVSDWREFAGAQGDERADALSTRMQEAWTSFAAERHAARRDDRRVAHGRARRSRCRRPGGRRRRRPPAAGLAGRGVSGLVGKVAIVTGASRGIGKGCALELGAAGATVYVTARSVTEADHPLPGTIGATAREVDDAGGTGVAVALDHRDDAAVEALFARVLDEHGRVDVLVNNAFIVTDELTSGLPFWQVPISNWDDMIDVGTRSAYVASVFAARAMVAAGSGLIANISSSGAEEYAWQVAYGVGKCALDRVTADTAHELGTARCLGGVAVARLRAHRADRHGGGRRSPAPDPRPQHL